MFRSYKDISIKKTEKTTIGLTSGHCCDLCGQGPWTSAMDVDIHRRHVHKAELLRALKDENTAMCSICLRVQENKKALVEHILVNHFCCPRDATMLTRETYICDHCHHLFFNKQLLISHMFHWHTRKTSENANTKQLCPVCLKNIRAKTSWFHLLYHGAINTETCPICLSSFESQYEMLEHIKTHPNLFRCNICNYETTKECYFNSHLAKHRKVIENATNDDASRFFLPEQLLPSLSNRMTNIFKGIPMANEVRICILCRALVFSVEQMNQHIFAAHVPEKKEKSKLYQCFCGEQFFNSILLKHHIFKLKGNHGACDENTPIPVNTGRGPQENVNVYQVYSMGDPLAIGLNEIIITDITSHSGVEENESCEDDQDVRLDTVFEVMES